MAYKEQKRKLILSLITIMGIILFSLMASALTNLTTCAELNVDGETYSLLNNVSSAYTCFNITANNIILEGNGQNITYGSSGNSSFGVLVFAKNNVTLRNLVINESSVFGNTRYGVYFLSSNDSTLTNSRISVGQLNGYGVFISNSKNNIIDSNTIRTGGTNGYSIYLSSSSNNTLIANKVTSTSGSAQSVYLQSSSNNTIISNNITASGLNAIGVYISSSSASNKILSNNITTISSNAYGIYVVSSIGQNITSNNIKTSGVGAFGLYMSTSSNNNIISSNILNVSSANRIVFDGSSINNNLTSNFIFNRNKAYFDLNIAQGTNNLWLIDQINFLENYTLLGTGSTINIKDTQYGEIRFNFPNGINGTGNNLSNNIKIADNLVFVDISANLGLNKVANITLYNIGNRGFANATILKDGLICPSDVCTNYTSLTATNVIFKVANWSNYSIGEVGADTTPPIIIFNLQTPSDLSSLNAISVGLNIKYNITDINLNLSSIYIFYKLNSSVSDNSFFINGSVISGWGNDAYNSNSSSTFSWLMGDNEVYPATYNLEDDVLDVTPHNLNTLTTNQNYISIQLLNLTNSTQYNFFEVMSNSSASQQIYYCNSSYSFASDPISNPVNSPRCTLAGTISAGSSYNHTHSIYSSHQLLPIIINTTTGQIGTVKVTPTSYFLIRGVGGGGNNINYYSVPIITRLGAMRTTTNNGALWTNQTYTVDAHLHQYSGVESFYYYVCANDTLNNANCSSIRQDFIELGGLPPSSPIVNSPLAYYYSGNLNINYTESSSPNGYAISYYNISLLDSLFAFNKTIVTNNSLNLDYTWNTVGTTDGLYIIRVQACDVLNQCSFGYSEIFGIDNTNPNGTLMQPINNLYTNITGINFTINATDNIGLSNITLFIYNGTVLITQQIQTVSGTGGIFGIFYNFLFNDVFTWFYRIIDIAGNIFTTENRTIIVDTVYPQLAISYPIDATNYDFVISNITHSVNETNLANCTFSNGTFSEYITCNAPYYFNASENINMWVITATDLAGQSYAKPTTFLVDTTDPIINFASGTSPNNTISNSGNVYVNVTINETNFYSITYLVANSTTTIQDITFFTPVTSVSFINQSENVYYYNVTIEDIVGRRATTETRLYTVDTTPPSLVVYSPTTTNYTNNLILVNLTSNGISTFYTNGTGLEEYLSPVLRIYPEGDFNFTAIAEDEAGNQNITNFEFFVDSFSPNINYISPTEANNSVKATNTVKVNVNATDVNFANMTIYLFNSTRNEIASAIDFNSPFYAEFTNLTNGIYYFNATACDTFNFCSFADTRKVTINQGLFGGLELSLVVPQYPYVDVNVTYPINVELKVGNFVVTDALTNFTLTLLNGTQISAIMPYNSTTGYYGLSLIFDEVGNFPFTITANSSSFGYTSESGTFIARVPFYLTIKLFEQGTLDPIENDFAYITAEYVGTRKIDGLIEPFIYPIADNRFVARSFHAPYINGEAYLKLYEPQTDYVFRYFDGIVTFDGEYSAPNVTKSYGTEVYLGTQYVNGTDSLYQFVLSEKDLKPYFWLFNWVLIILLVLVGVGSLAMFFFFPDKPQIALVFGVLFTLVLIGIRVAVYLWMGQ